MGLYRSRLFRWLRGRFDEDGNRKSELDLLLLKLYHRNALHGVIIVTGHPLEFHGFERGSEYYVLLLGPYVDDI
jgi:hypothetical protein